MCLLWNDAKKVDLHILKKKEFDGTVVSMYAESPLMERFSFGAQLVPNSHSEM